MLEGLDKEKIEKILEKTVPVEEQVEKIVSGDISVERILDEKHGREYFQSILNSLKDRQNKFMQAGLAATSDREAGTNIIREEDQEAHDRCVKARKDLEEYLFHK